MLCVEEISCYNRDTYRRIFFQIQERSIFSSKYPSSMLRQNTSINIKTSTPCFYISFSFHVEIASTCFLTFPHLNHFQLWWMEKVNDKMSSASPLKPYYFESKFTKTKVNFLDPLVRRLDRRYLSTSKFSFLLHHCHRGVT